MGNRLLVFKYHQHTDIYRSSSSSSSSKYHQNTDHYQKASKSKVEISLLMRCYHIIPQNPIKKKKHKKKANDRKSPKNLYRGTTSDSSAPHSAPGAPAARQRGAAARRRARALVRQGPWRCQGSWSLEKWPKCGDLKGDFRIVMDCPMPIQIFI